MFLLKPGHGKLTTPSDSLLHTACVNPPALAGAVERLPSPLRASARPLWSEKTTVCRIFSCKRAWSSKLANLTAGGGPRHPYGLQRLLLSNIWWRCHSRQARALTACPVSLAGTYDCYISATGVQAEVQSISSFSSQKRSTTVGASRQASLAEARSAWQMVQARRPQAKAGGEYRARTGDLLVANQALSQLS
jgi:hypothetical protein